jgi:hypothetical protein
MMTEIIRVCCECKEDLEGNLSPTEIKEAEKEGAMLSHGICFRCAVYVYGLDKAERIFKLK